MTHKYAKIRPAVTALAAAIALSSPAFAQSVEEPIVTTTPPVDETPAPVAADPVVDTTADPLAAETAPATPVRKATPARTTAARSRPAATRATSPARASSPAAAAAPAAAIAAPVAEAPAAQPLPPPTEIAADPIVEPAATNSSMNMLTAAGIGGAALVLLAGAGLAVRRRRRRAEEAENAEWQAAEADAEPATLAEPEPATVEPEPAFVAAPSAAPALAAATPPDEDAPVTELPEDFDLSRFGYNVQQAYKGPTEDNPSLSMKNRLHRASGMDQQERNVDAEVEAATGESVLADADEALAEAAAANPDPAHPAADDPGLSGDAKPGVRPTYTH
jgi:LPXTG-motif cell wall-anchored protein